MQTFREVTPGDRVVIRCTGPFQVWAGTDEDMKLVGPHSADLRITSFQVQRDWKTLMVDHAADVQLDITCSQNRFSEADESTLFKQLDIGQPQSIRDVVANTVAELLSRQNGAKHEPETVEEANDFDLPEWDWADEEFANAHRLRELQAEYVEAVEPPPEPAAEPEPPAPEVAEPEVDPARTG